MIGTKSFKAQGNLDKNIKIWKFLIIGFWNNHKNQLKMFENFNNRL